MDDIVGKLKYEAEPSEQANDDGRFMGAFAGYRNLKRRIAGLAKRGIMMPFFQPRDGVSTSVIRWQGRGLINYSGYNYLGLSGHPEVSAAAKAAIDKYGTSASASRIVSGQIGLHGDLEKRIAKFIGTQDAIVFVSGYLTNVTVISHLLSRVDGVIYDDAAHNSIMTGARLSGAKMITFPYGDWKGLEANLSQNRSEFRRGLLVGEGVYSMDGMVYDLKRAVELKRKHDLLLMIDEAHSLGTLGATGRGICEHTGIPSSSVDVHMGTLSKTLAGCGGYIAGDRDLIEYLRYLAPGFIFSVGLSPPDTGAAMAALDILEREPQRTQELRQRTHFFRQLARQYGLPLGGEMDAPVASLVIGNGNTCMMVSQRLLEAGIHVQPIVHPAVAVDGARLRFFITIDHTEAQFRATMPAIAKELEAIGQLVG
ncbi:MAG: aminotransferase class I/II-fold pyridoxal phosphate-dependent enzyme [Alphaproteobacteria bacterium]|nr:aminotransferase class I/II-fold pyridoxal phosphate-dependent enzyme [Alphaproteobacteria bacterium]